MLKPTITATSAFIAVFAGGTAQASYDSHPLPLRVHLHDQTVMVNTEESLACLPAGLEAAQHDASILMEIVTACGFESTELDAVELTRISSGSQF